ncbi:DoxX family protein [Bradyrhizobium sp.]|uniref:DoxX family protein n=2 Tax=Bradyrhizobium sp. TaxID=376 RepID=UPI00239A0CD4|nr:DoxX family protein [Bradyrhizobium sp.]MDE1936403.1 DoxX family protein [Bradyrhizobium sp.]MDE2063403.1 DoxX family protein [Bradyrhizobium sp.]
MTTPGMTTPTQDKVLLAARLLVTPLFIYSGIGKVLAFEVTAGRLPGGAGGFGSVLAACAIAIELGGSLALILGIYARYAALAFIVFTILASVMFHNFWASPPAQVVGQTINFGKNLGLIGLFAVLAAFGPGNYALRK